MIPAKVEISYKTIVFTVFFLIFLWFLTEVREIIFLVFVAFILMSALKPLADWLEKFHIPRFIAVILIYVLIIALLAFMGSSILPPLISESIRLGENMPKYVGPVLPFLKIDSQTLTQPLTFVGENVLKMTFGLFHNLFTTFTFFVISFYLLIERKHLDLHLSQFMGEEAAKKSVMIIKKVEERLGAWVRGQVTLALTIGICTFIGLFFLGIPYSLPLAILAGILEIIPTIGPIISAIPAVLVAVTLSPVMALLTVALYFVVQQLENHLVVPLVMKKVVGVPPLFTIIALLVGAKLAGIGGALLAVPIMVTIETIISSYLALKESS